MRLAAPLGLACLVAMSGGAAGGQDASGDERVLSEIKAAMAHIQFARCAGDKTCEPASAAELADPPLTLPEAKIVLRRGVLDGAAKFCGMDFQTVSFGPMMDHWRGQAKSDRQLALITILHGMAQAQAEAAMGADPCTEAVRQNIRSVLPFRP